MSKYPMACGVPNYEQKWEWEQQLMFVAGSQAEASTLLRVIQEVVAAGPGAASDSLTRFKQGAGYQGIRHTGPESDPTSAADMSDVNDGLCEIAQRTAKALHVFKDHSACLADYNRAALALDAAKLFEMITRRTAMDHFLVHWEKAMEALAAALTGRAR